MNNTKQDKVFNLIGILCLGLGAGVLIRTACLTFVSDIWFDELFTVELAAKPIAELISLASRDVHPPIYYVIVRGIYLFLHQINSGIGIEAAAKLSSIVPYFLMIVYSLTLIRKRFGVLSAGLFILLVELMPQLSQYMVEARMYSWAMFAVLAMFLHGMEAVVFCTEQKACGQYIHLICAILYGVLSMYLHYYAFIGAAAIGLCMLIFSILKNKKMILPICVAMVICIASYLPWIKVVMSQVGAVKANYWIQPVSIRTLAGCVKYIFKPEFESGLVNYLCAGILMAGYVFLFAVFVFGKEFANKGLDTEEGVKQNFEERAYILFSALVPVILVLIGMLASIIIKPVFVYRYMIPVLGVFWLGFAILLGLSFRQYLEKKNVFIIAGVLLVVMSTMSIRDYNLFKWEEQKKQSGMETTSEFFDMVKKEYPNAVLVCNFNQVQAILWHYLDNDSILWGETDETLIAEICDRYPIMMEQDTDGLLQKIKELSPDLDSFIFVGSGNAREEILEDWEAQGFTSELLIDSCLLERYYFNIYKVRVKYEEKNH